MLLCGNVLCLLMCSSRSLTEFNYEVEQNQTKPAGWLSTAESSQYYNVQISSVNFEIS